MSKALKKTCEQCKKDNYITVCNGAVSAFHAAICDGTTATLQPCVKAFALGAVMGHEWQEPEELDA